VTLPLAIKKGLLAIATVVLTVASVEFAMGVALSNDLSAHNILPLKTHSPREKNHYEMEFPKFSPPPPPPPQDIKNILKPGIATGGYYADAPVQKGLPHFSGRMKKHTIAPPHTLLFDVGLNLDSKGRRVTRLPGLTRPTEAHLLIFGCSYAFGEGVEDSETFAWKLGEKLPRHQVYNLAFPGYGPHDLIARTIDSGSIDDIAVSNGTAIYIFTTDQLRRVVGTATYIGAWGATSPVLRNENHKIVILGRFVDIHPLKSAIYDWISRRNIFRFFKMDWPVISERDYEKFADHILWLREEYRKHTSPNNDFVFVFYPERSRRLNYEWLRANLEKRQISFLDYTDRPMDHYLAEKSEIPLDGHPSAAAHEKLAEMLLSDLKL